MSIDQLEAFLANYIALCDISPAKAAIELQKLTKQQQEQIYQALQFV